MGSGGSKGPPKVGTASSNGNANTQKQQQQKNGAVISKSTNSQQINGKQTPIKPTATGTAKPSPKDTKSNQKDTKPAQKKTDQDDIEELRKRAIEGKTMLRQRTLFVHGNGNTGGESSGKIHPLFRGSLSPEFPSTAKIVRIFTSSTFTDTKVERNMLMDKAYPKIKTFCQNRGYEFQVVDMRWGVRDEATDDHSGNDLCLKELKLCKTLSTGPNFVLLLAQKYGSRSLLREVEAEEFEKIYNAIESDTAKALLKRWFKRDDNAVPPVYVLQPISKYLPDYLSHDKDKKLDAKEKWLEDNREMQDALSSVAENVLGLEAARKYTISITEKEAQMGMLQCFDANKACVWFKRTITDIEQQKPVKLVDRFRECLGPEEKWKKAREMHKELSEEKIPNVLPAKRIFNYNVKWTPVGIDPENSEHKKYLEKLCNEFVKELCNMVADGMKERSTSDISDPLYEECYLHSSFCRSKCQDFQGREQTLKKIENYVTSKSFDPLVVHGVSGCGKTSIMAKAAQLAGEWMKGKAVVVLRFVGTTPESSSINDFLGSTTLQIKKNYGEESNIPEDLKELILEFHSSLGLAKWSQPLVLIIDSLDQFDPANGARTLSWLPKTLPPHVKLLVSTLEEPEYESFPKLKSMKLPKENFIPVPKLPDQDVVNIVKHWLSNRKRTLTPSQHQILSKSFEKCPLPIFLKLAFDEACRWTSYDDKSVTVLQTTIRNSINMLFERLEIKHGKTYVSRALGYLTEARSGLSTAELEDVLACDDDVLNDVYEHATPPMRRLPPLVLVRLKDDLKQYLVERGADGIRVLFWYHRQFIEAANDRYCGNDVVQQLNAALAEFFSGTWSQGKLKPYVDRSGQGGKADRHVTSQPLKFGDNYNIRKLNNLPHHRALANHLDLLKEECLCNFDFILAKLLTSSIRQVIEDFVVAKKRFPEDNEISLITDALQLSQSALIYDPLQLAPQMLDRMAGEQAVVSFLKQCESFNVPFLKPSTEILTKPGGQLVYCLAGHTEPVRGLDMKKNGREVVTCSEDDTIKTWDIIEGHMIKSYDGVGIDPDGVYYVCSDHLIMAHYQQKIKGIRPAGDVAYTIDFTGEGAAYGVGGKNKSFVVVFENQAGKVYCAETGKHLHTVQHPDSVPFQEMGYVPGSANHMILKDRDGVKISVMDLVEKSFTSFKHAFPLDNDDERPEIEGMVISANDKFFLCTNFTSPYIHIFDISTLKEDTVIKGSPDKSSLEKVQSRGSKKEVAQALHFTPSGKHLFSALNKHVSVRSMETGAVELVLEHPADIDDVVSVDAQTFVTRSDDVVIRVWDLSRTEKEAGVSDLSHSDRITKMEPMPNCRYVVCQSKAVDKSNLEVSVYLQVYDLAENVIVRQAEVMDSEARVLRVLNDSEIIIATFSRKLKVINLNTMTVARVFQGKIHKRLPDILVLKDGKEVAVTTRSRMALKVYDTATGKVKIIIQSHGSDEIEEIKASSDGSIILARTFDGPYAVFDLKKGQLIKALSESDFGFSEFLSTESMISSSMLSSNGSYIGIAGTKSIPIPTLDGETSDENIMCIWDVRAGKKTIDLYDEFYHTKYETKDNRKGLSIGVDEVANLSDSLIMTAHDDFIIRIWDITSGKLLKRLFGHTTNIELRAIDKSPYFLTYGCWEEENALRLWDKQNYEPICSYKVDKLLSKNAWCTDGRSFISTMRDPAKIIHWKISGSSSNMAAYPSMYKDKKCDLQIEFESEEDSNKDSNDPDQCEEDDDEQEDDD